MKKPISDRVKTLVLDKQYQTISFIGFRKLAMFLIKDKVEVISEWEDSPIFYNGFKYPSIVRLHTYIRRRPVVPRWSRNGMFKRDGFRCQYSGVVFPVSQLTVDHVIPESRGGKTSWENCVTSHLNINMAKGSRTPEEAGLKLLSVPKPPAYFLDLDYKTIKPSHSDWKMYFSGVDIDA